MVRVDQRGTAVSVREGKVVVHSTGGVDLSADAGSSVTFDRRNFPSENAITSHSQMWNWIMEIAPRASADRASVAEILEWIARESGRSIVYADGVQSIAESTMIDGLPDVTPLVALDALSAATDLNFELAGAQIWVRRSASTGTDEN